MKKTLLILFFILIINQVFSQEIIIGLKSGIGTYSMSDLKPFNKQTLQYLPFDARTVSDFPPFLFYQPVISLSFNHYRIGIIYTFQSTGSRVSAKDYSAEYHFDMKVHAHTPGIYQELRLYSINNYEFSVYSNLGLLMSKLKMNHYLELSGTTVSDNTNVFRSYNYYIEPGISFAYSINRIFSMGINAGYLVQFGDQAFYTDHNSEHILENPDTREPIKPGWNGLRIGLALSYKLGRNDQ